MRLCLKYMNYGDLRYSILLDLKNIIFQFF